MLHKSKSKKINQFKYLLVIPILALFLMSFNTEEVYVEKEQENVLSESSYDSEKDGDKIEITINKKTSDKNLNEFKNRFKDEFNLDFTWKNLKRNTTGDISSIEIKLDVGAKGHVISNAYDDNGIKPFIIYYKKNGGMGTYRKENKTIDNSELYISEYDMPYSEEGPKYSIVNDIIKQNKQAVLYFHNGNEINLKTLKKINNHSIISVGYYKGKTAIEKYGERTKHGIIEITTKKQNKNSESKNTSNEEIVVVGYQDKNTLYFIDKKESTKEEVDKINEDDIYRTNILKEEDAIKKYGERAKDGVIEILTRKGFYVGPNAIYIIDGIEKEFSWKQIEESDNIESIGVLSNEDGIQDYGEREKDGVVIITTKKQDINNQKQSSWNVQPSINSSHINNQTQNKNTSKTKNNWKVQAEIKLSNGENQIVNKNTLYIIDQKESTLKEFAKIDPKNVIDISAMPEEKAIIEYGERAKDGVIEIITRKGFYIGVDAIYIIDSKESTREEYKKIDKKDIKSFVIMINEDGIKKYGERAKDGVAIITTKKH